MRYNGLRSKEQRVAFLGIMKHIVMIVPVSLAFILCATPSRGATENLDQAIARKSRMSSATWSNTLLENSTNSFIWQPETLSYADITTGNEVWKMSATPSRYNSFHSDIGVSPWSANGNRMAFKSNRDTAAFNRSGSNPWMIVNTDGSRLRPIAGAPARVDSHTPYFHWSPKLPDVYYELGKTAAGNTGVTPNILYKATVSDTAVSRSPLVTLPTTKGTDLKLNKTVSGDGNKAIVMTNTETWLFPVTIADGAAALDVSSGYTVNRAMSGTWGDTPLSYAAHHDAYYPGDGSYLFLMPSGTHAWWKDKVLGSAADGGSVYSYTAPSTFGEQIPVNTTNNWGGTADPFGSDYWSHFVPDKWGRHALFSSVDAPSAGPGVWDMATNRYTVYSFGGMAQHHDWSAFSDWTLSSRGPTGADYSADRLYTQKYSAAGSQQTIAYTHTLFNNGGTYVGAAYEYDALARPGQSPDGTKAAFHSTFLNNKGATYDNLPDIFWAVAYYPFPPEIKSAVKNGANVRLTWDFNQGTVSNPNYTNPRTYTKRGWPNETSDRPPSPREIKQFRVWSSPDNSTWTSLGTTNYGNSGGGWTENAWTYDAPQTNGTTRYYAVTSLEHSGLESRSLSNVWKVVLDANGSVTQQVQQSTYPANPGGKSSFYTNLPSSPLTVTSTHMLTPASAAGQYTLTWNAPANKTLIRYYNIYAADGSVPAALQQNRIASVPATSDYAGTGAYKYIDWLGKTDGTTKYFVTAVDFQGNESPSAGSIHSPVGFKGSIISK